MLDCARITFGCTAIITHCLQVALVAGTTFTVVEIFSAILFLATRDDNDNGYSPSSKMVILHMFMRGTDCQHTEHVLHFLLDAHRVGMYANKLRQL